MEKLVETIVVDRYSIQKSNMDYRHFDFVEELLGRTPEEMVVYFNTSNSGLRDFSNFLKAEEAAFDDVETIEQVMKAKNLNFYTVVSFYRENGYDGVYHRTGKDSLEVKCNNWVNFGQDGFLFIVMTKEKEDIDLFVKNLQTYVNEGYYAIEVYDRKEDEFIDSYYNLPEEPYENYRKWKEELIKDYGFKESQFDNLG